MALIFVDCEAVGGCPRTGNLTEFGAVDYDTMKTFHGVLFNSRPSKTNPAIPEIIGEGGYPSYPVFEAFRVWLSGTKGRPVFVSDNPAYDFQWINDGFLTTLGVNPFGHSGRRISDFYAGLVGDFYNAQKWKRLRVTKHDHNPVNDALGNAEAFRRLMKGER